MGVGDRLVTLDGLKAVHDYTQAQIDNMQLLNIKTFPQHLGYFTSGEGPVWKSTSATDTDAEKYRHILIPIKSGDTFQITSGDKTLYWGVLNTSYDPDNPPAHNSSASAHLATGYETRRQLTANKTSDPYTAPNDAAYLFVMVRWGVDSDTTPASLIINGWDYVKNARTIIQGIKDTITADEASISGLQTAVAAIPGKADGGYVDITWQLIYDLNITIPAVGAAVSLTPDLENTAYAYLVKHVKAGDKFRVTGSGSNPNKLWTFADENLIVLSRSANYLNAEGEILTASADGYLIMNFVTVGTASNPKLPPSVEIFIHRADQYAEEDALRTAYLMRQDAPNVLTAFSNIVCCGDSLTRSVVYTGMDGQNNVTRMAYRTWPEILEAKTGANTSYIAYGGFDASTWWSQYNGQIAAADNQLAIIYLGTNGSLTDTIDTDAPGTDKSGYDVTTNTGAYCKIVKSWIDVGARVLLVHVKKTTNSIWTTNAVIDKIAEKFGVAVVDVPLLRDAKYHSWPDGTGLNSVHYNDLGYAAFADLLIRCVGSLNDEMMIRLIPV